MRSKKVIVLGICAVLLVAMAGAGMVMASENNAAICETCETSNAPGDSVGGAVYTFSIGPGSRYSQGSTLKADAPKDYDTWKMTVTKDCTVTVRVVDCCIMNDTMGLKAGPKIYKATSPDVITVSAPLKPGTYTFYTGYIKCPGGYPAGYDVDVTAVSIIQ